MAKYDKDKVIGSGAFGSVWLVKSKLSRQTYVMKEVNLNSLTESDKQQAMNEVSVLQRFRHDHIIRYKDAMLDQDILSIVMEHADGGDLHAAIIKQNGVPFTEHRVITWFVEICLALQYIHHNNILHRDLKSQNVFLTRKNKSIKIGDFGISRILKGPEELAKTAVGTPYYLSPEICQRKPYNYKSDVWALGCLLFEMAALEQAFKAKDFFHLLTLILGGKRRELPRHCTPLMKELVNNLLCIDPVERPSTSEILAYPSLETYLSKYMIIKNVWDDTLTNTNELNARKGFAIKGHKDSIKRRASIASLDQKVTKQRTLPLAEPEPSRFRFQVRPGSVLKPVRPTPVSRANKLKRQMSNKPPTPKILPGKVKTNKSNFTASCDTYNVMHTNIDPKSLLTMSEDLTLDNEPDNGYPTKETNTFASKNASGFSTLSFKKLFSLSKFNRHFEENKKVAGFGTASSRQVNSGYLDSCTSIGESANSSDLHHCQHSLCQQCIFDTFWRNRIRCSAKSSVDTGEYSELKDKLLMVFKRDLFQKVYQSLACDWEGTDSSVSESFQDILNSLTWVQVQSIPLVMQLIQLELFMGSRK